jgi:hypothetical protein
MQCAQQYHLPSCMRMVEAAHVVEIIQEHGSPGLHVDRISQLCGVDASKLGVSSLFYSLEGALIVSYSSYFAPLGDTSHLPRSHSRCLRPQSYFVHD